MILLKILSEIRKVKNKADIEDVFSESCVIDTEPNNEEDSSNQKKK